MLGDPDRRLCEARDPCHGRIDTSGRASAAGDAVTTRWALAGAVATLSALALLVAVGAWVIPTTMLLGPFARLLDAPAPIFLGVALALALATAALGPRRLGLALAILSISTGLVGLQGYFAVTAPPVAGEARDLRILFFNAEYPEAEAQDRLVDAILAADADIVVLAETELSGPARAGLDAAYPFVSPCLPEVCDMLIASRRPVLRFWRLQLNAAWPDRYAVAEVELASGAPLFVSAVHLVKPWFSGIAESEIGRLTAQYAWFDGPAVAVGDYNMTPWSRPMRRLLATTGFRAVRGQVGTWPAEAPMGRFPIDQVLVREGVRVTTIETFGRELGSNHLGLVAELSVAAPTR